MNEEIDNLNDFILNQQSKCPVPNNIYRADELHDFVKDYKETKFYSVHKLKGIHCSKCGLTIKYPNNDSVNYHPGS